jgi:hypothetical protein
LILNDCKLSIQHFKKSIAISSKFVLLLLTIRNKASVEHTYIIIEDTWLIACMQGKWMHGTSHKKAAKRMTGHSHTHTCMDCLYDWHFWAFCPTTIQNKPDPVP